MEIELKAGNADVIPEQPSFFPTSSTLPPQAGAEVRLILQEAHKAGRAHGGAGPWEPGKAHT